MIGNSKRPNWFGRKGKERLFLAHLRRHYPCYLPYCSYSSHITLSTLDKDPSYYWKSIRQYLIFYLLIKWQLLPKYRVIVACLTRYWSPSSYICNKTLMKTLILVSLIIVVRRTSSIMLMESIKGLLQIFWLFIVNGSDIYIWLLQHLNNYTRIATMTKAACAL